MKKTVVLLVVLVIATVSYGQQTDSGNTLSFMVGPGYSARQDLIFSPLVHRDLTSVNVGLAYARKAKAYQSLVVRYANFAPIVGESYQFLDHGESKTASPHYFTLVDIDYSIGKNIAQSGRSTTTLGGRLSSDLQLLNYAYGRVGSTGYYLSFGLGPFIKQDYQISERSRLTAQLQLPLISWLARSPYLVNDDEFIENISAHSDFKSFAAFIGDGNFATLNQVQSLDLSVGYAYRLSQKWKIGADYWFEFMHASSPRSLLSFRNSLSFSANFTF